MIEYISIKNEVLKNGDFKNIKSIENSIIAFFCDFDIQYDNFAHWFTKIFYETINQEIKRDIILAMSGEKIAGLLILKDFDNEKKVCTLVVHEDFRMLGIATRLFEISFERLGTIKPSYTISDKLVHTFDGLVKKFGFTKTDVKFENGRFEHYFN